MKITSFLDLALSGPIVANIRSRGAVLQAGQKSILWANAGLGSAY
jgi:hypothetical protein